MNVSNNGGELKKKFRLYQNNIKIKIINLFKIFLKLRKYEIAFRDNLTINKQLIIILLKLHFSRKIVTQSLE